MCDWSELDRDLLVLVVKRINLIEDYLSFGTVCKSWHSVATKDNFNSDLPRVPWLMLAEEEDDDTCRKFFSLENGMILKKSIPGARGKRCVESLGWLVTVRIGQNEISLLHPFSGVEIQLPDKIRIPVGHQRNNGYYGPDTFSPAISIHKAVLSANPSHTSDYILMIIEGDFNFLSIWRPGDLSWTRLPAYNGKISDVVYFNRKFYAVDHMGCIKVWDVAGSKLGESHTVAQLNPCIDDLYYILESLGSLFVVVQQFVGLWYDRDEVLLSLILGGDDEEGTITNTYRTKTFLVCKIDLDACEATPTMDLGDRALFLGPNASISVQASQFPGIKPNHIYFTDNCLSAYLRFEGGCGLDMGVFNLADESIQPHYDGVSLSRVSPPIWVTPNPC